jgi:phosphoribosylanthranilate isomerase
LGTKLFPILSKIKLLQVKIIASGIINLTDARYFAAMGVDWMGFDMRMDSPLTITHVVSFANWIEGPDFFLDVRSRSIDQIGEMLGYFPAGGLLTDKEISLPNFAGKMIMSPAKEERPDNLQDTIIIDDKQWRHMVSEGIFDSVAEIWIKIANVTQYRNLKAEMDNLSGIVVTGGDEQAVGLKSYDDLDELFDLIWQ